MRPKGGQHNDANDYNDETTINKQLSSGGGEEEQHDSLSIVSKDGGGGATRQVFNWHHIMYRIV